MASSTSFMKPSSGDRQLRLASPLQSAAGQSRRTNNPSENETGLDVSHHTRVSPQGRGQVLFLDILFHTMSEVAMLRQQRELVPKPRVEQKKKSAESIPLRTRVYQFAR